MEHHNLQPSKLWSHVLQAWLLRRSSRLFWNVQKKAARVRSDAATSAVVVTNLNHRPPPPHSRKTQREHFSKKVGRGWGSGSGDGCVLRDAAAILCTQIKFFVFSFLRQTNMAARHYTWQYANYKFYLPLTRNNFFLSKCTLHMYTHKNNISCDLPSAPIFF